MQFEKADHHVGFLRLVYSTDIPLIHVPELLCVGEKLVLNVGEDLNHLRDDDRPQEGHVYS